jgi:acetate kinase
MKENILVLNAGSSSLKFCVFEHDARSPWQLGVRGQISGIGTSPRFVAKDSRGNNIAEQVLDNDVKDGSTAIGALTDWFRQAYRGVHVTAVGHRVVHGGAKYSAPTLVDPKVFADLTDLIPIAPLHQPHNLEAIEAVSDRMPDTPQVACFDTAFHRGRSEVATLLPLPKEIRGHNVQRYGFHGLSYEYIASVLPEVAPEIAERRVVVAHLGNGTSMCALKGGKSMDITHGFTALDGLCMGTRPGALDPGAVLFMFQNLGLSVKDVESVLYTRSGLMGISGRSSDMRELLESRDREARLAIDYFVYQASKQLGAMAAVLGGIEGLVFTAGIGENSPVIRQRICEAGAWLGIEIDASANARNGLRISTAFSTVSTWVIPTNEELAIARHTASLLHLETRFAGVPDSRSSSIPGPTDHRLIS